MKIAELKLYTLGFFSSATFASAIILPFYFFNHIDEQQTFVLIAIYQVAVLLFEIPTWLVATRYGEKVSIICWYALSFLMYLLFPFMSTFFWFVILQIISALSVAFLSWSMSAFIKDFSVHHGMIFTTIKSKYRIVTLLTWILTTIIWWLLIAFWYLHAFFLQAFIYIVAVIVIQWIQSNPVHITNTFSIKKILSKSLKILSHRQILQPSFLVYSFLALEASVYISFQYEYIDVLQFNELYLWFFLALFSVASIVFTRLIVHKKRSLHPFFLLWIGLIFLVTSWFHLLYGAFLTLLLYYFTQIIRPMDIPLEEKILHSIDDKSWSTILSLLWFFERIVFLLIAVVMIVLHVQWVNVIFFWSWIVVLIYILMLILPKNIWRKVS